MQYLEIVFQTLKISSFSAHLTSSEICISKGCLEKSRPSVPIDFITFLYILQVFSLDVEKKRFKGAHIDDFLKKNLRYEVSVSKYEMQVSLYDDYYNSF